MLESGGDIDERRIETLIEELKATVGEPADESGESTPAADQRTARLPAADACRSTTSGVERTSRRRAAGIT